MRKKKTMKVSRKRQKVSRSSAHIQKMEKELLLAPTKFAAQISKEMKPLINKENKLKNAINKMAEKIKKSEKNLDRALQKTATPAAKKRLKKVKKLHDLTLANQSHLNNVWQETKNMLEIYKEKQAKLIALSKYLKQFEKEWQQQQNAATKKDSTTKRKTRSKKSAVHKQDQPFTEQPSFVQVEANIANIQQDESFETTN